MPDLRRRCRMPEVMDQNDLAVADHHQALAGLARLNRFSRSARLLWPPIREAADASAPLRILDVATGAGDIPIRLAQLAAAESVRIYVAGCDISETAVASARRRAQESGHDVEFFLHDVVRDPFPNDFDVITASLFLHHLDSDEACRLVRRLAEAARRLILISDLVRTTTGYWLAWLASRFLTRSWVVRVDAPRSVQAAFSISEARALAAHAGLPHATITQHWPQRFLLKWSRPA